MVFYAQSLVFLALHGFDGDADARDLVHALPDGVAGAFTNGFLDSILVEGVGEALDGKHGRDEFFAGLASFSEYRTTLILWQNKLDRVPE